MKKGLRRWFLDHLINFLASENSPDEEGIKTSFVLLRFFRGDFGEQP